MENKPELTIDHLLDEAKLFCHRESKAPNSSLFGVTDGKAVGTYIEHKFKETIAQKYNFLSGSSASGIDFPGASINTDMKVTSIVQPQSSCPFKSARQKIYGLGYNLLVFVYDKSDDQDNQTSNLNFVSCIFFNKERTADYQMTKSILQIIENDGNTDDIKAYLEDRNIPVDDIALNTIAEEILKKPPLLGYLTIFNALQWRLQYKRIVSLSKDTEDIVKIIDNIPPV